MKLQTIAEHTIDIDRLTKGGWVLDAGCRNFTFARTLSDFGCKVLAIDADPTVASAENPGVILFSNVAVAAEAGKRKFLMHDNPEARCLTGEGTGQFERIDVEAVTVKDLMELYGIDRWDVVKLDIEGAEYDILKRWPGPIAKQISIEFHEHVYPRPDVLYEEIFHHLSQWYTIVQHVKERRHCTHPNFWDTLLVEKST